MLLVLKSRKTHIFTNCCQINKPSILEKKKKLFGGYVTILHPIFISPTNADGRYIRPGDVYELCCGRSNVNIRRLISHCRTQTSENGGTSCSKHTKSPIWDYDDFKQS